MSHDLHTRLRALAGDDWIRNEALTVLLRLASRVPCGDVTAEDLGRAQVALLALAELHGVPVRDVGEARHERLAELEDHARMVGKVAEARNKPHRFEGLARNARATLQVTQAADQRGLRVEVDGDDLVLYSTDIAAIDVLAAWDGSAYQGIDG